MQIYGLLFGFVSGENESGRGYADSLPVQELLFYHIHDFIS